MTVKVKSTYSRHIVVTMPVKDVSYESKTAIEEFFGDEIEADYRGDGEIYFTLESDSKFIGLSDESIARHVVQLIARVRKENEEYEDKMKKKYESFLLDIPTEHNSGIAMELADSIRKYEKQARKYAKEKDFGLAVASLQDAHDILDIYNLVSESKWVKAHHLIREMDTSIREELSSCRRAIAKFAGLDY